LLDPGCDYFNITTTSGHGAFVVHLAPAIVTSTLSTLPSKLGNRNRHCCTAGPDPCVERLILRDQRNNGFSGTFEGPPACPMLGYGRLTLLVAKGSVRKQFLVSTLGRAACAGNHAEGRARDNDVLISSKQVWCCDASTVTITTFTL
jgi:hypothetical protein